MGSVDEDEKSHLVWEPCSTYRRSVDSPRVGPSLYIGSRAGEAMISFLGLLGLRNLCK